MAPAVKRVETPALPTEAEFWAFTGKIPVGTKDFGITTIRPWGTQRHLIARIFGGIKRGVRQFVILKARQVGASTELELLTLMWHWRLAGLQGLCAADSDATRDYFRDQLAEMCFALAAAPPADYSALRANNRDQLAWDNGSRLMLQTAGPRAGRRLGVGRGVAYAWGSECSRWARGEFLAYLRSAFSEVNPYSLYAFESTALGKGWWYDLWLDSQDAASIEAIFLGWWLREDNRLKRHDPRWARYGDDPTLTPREREWDAQLRERYKVILKPEQWAWRRWYVAEKAGHSQRLADQEMPTLPEDAFNATQDRPFIDVMTEERLRLGLETVRAPQRYAYKWAMNLEDTHPEPVVDEPASLRVWQPPDLQPAIVAVVPAYSAMPDDPAWVISVWLASLETDRLEQAAEFVTEVPIGLQPCSWVALHLAGCYGAVGFILEVAGLGQGVLMEIKRLVASGWGTARRPEFRDLLGGVRHYIWRRADSMAGGGSYQWKSTAETQGPLLQRLRDQIVRGTVVIRSPELVDEMERLQGVGDSYEPAGREPRGHRTMAAALAVESWSAQLYPMLKKLRAQHQATSVPQRTVQDFIGSLGRRPGR